MKYPINQSVIFYFLQIYVTEKNDVFYWNIITIPCVTRTCRVQVLPDIIAPFHHPHSLQTPPFYHVGLLSCVLIFTLSLNLYACTSKCKKPCFTFFAAVDAYMVVPHKPPKLHSWNWHPFAAHPSLTLVWFNQVTCFDQMDTSELRPNKSLHLSTGPLRTFSVEDSHRGLKKLGWGYWIVRRHLESEREVTWWGTDAPALWVKVS